MTTATEVKMEFLCSNCLRNVICICERHNCEHNHTLCSICEFIDLQIKSGVKPIKSTIKDRGTGRSRYAKYNEGLISGGHVKRQNATPRLRSIRISLCKKT